MDIDLELLSVRQRTVALLKALAPDEGYNLTPLVDVRLLRSNRPLGRTPVLYDPGIVIVCQGRKRGYLGEQVYVYDAQHYLAVSVPVPFTMETEASAEEPLLAMYFRLDFYAAADVLLQIDAQGLSDEANGEPKGMLSSPMDARLSASVLRLLEALAAPLETAVLGPALVREIYFRVLTGEQGGSLRAALTQQGQFARVSRALRRIHADYADGDKLTVQALAREAAMSIPTFHAHFKTVTSTSPMQYLKSTRLHQARLLMVRNDVTASVASNQVGYESLSQFSREFKRLFGRSPVEEAERMRRAFALPPPAPGTVFVSSH